MSENYIPKIAKMLGVDVWEEFKIAYSDGPDPKGTYQLTDKSLLHIDGDSTVLAEEWLVELLNGSAEIVKKPWKPKHGETFRYWAISFMEDMPMTLMIRPWDENSTYYFMLYRLGNCYPTKEEAEADREKWERFYGDDSPIDWEGKS